MSWSEHLENLKKQNMSHAAVCGLDQASWMNATENSNRKKGWRNREHLVLQTPSMKFCLGDQSGQSLQTLDLLSIQRRKITQEELANLLSAMKEAGQLESNGIRLGGEKYMYLSGDDKICRGKKGTSGVHCAKSKKTLVVGIYEDPVQAVQAASAVEKVADYLSSHDF